MRSIFLSASCTVSLFAQMFTPSTFYTSSRETERAQRRVLVRQDTIRRLRTVLVGVAVFGVGLLMIQAVAIGLLPPGWYLLSILPIISGPFIIIEGIID